MAGEVSVSFAKTTDTITLAGRVLYSNPDHLYPINVEGGVVEILVDWNLELTNNCAMLNASEYSALLAQWCALDEPEVSAEFPMSGAFNVSVNQTVVSDQETLLSVNLTWCVNYTCPPPPPEPSSSSTAGSASASTIPSSNAISSSSEGPTNWGLCSFTQGYWKNIAMHPWPAGYNPSDKWFNSTIVFPALKGSLNPWMSWIDILRLAPGQQLPGQRKPNSCGRYCQLAHQYIAAKLNVALFGAEHQPDAVLSALRDAEMYFGSLGVWSGQESDLPAAMGNLATFLASYNQGELPNVPHCDGMTSEEFYQGLAVQAQEEARNGAGAQSSALVLMLLALL
eukprot:m51a1_g5642 hypothetical protein (339) ;mRNA; r:852688-853995